jgi:hypothetical protein
MRSRAVEVDAAEHFRLGRAAPDLHVVRINLVAE